MSNGNEERGKLIRDKIIAKYDAEFVIPTQKHKIVVTVKGLAPAEITNNCLSKEMKAIFDYKHITYDPVPLPDEGLKTDLFGNGIKLSWHGEEIKISYGGDTVKEFTDIERNIIKWLEAKNIHYQMGECIGFCSTKFQQELLSKTSTSNDDRLRSILDKRKEYVKQ